MMALRVIASAVSIAGFALASGVFSLPALANDTSLVVSNLPGEFIVGDPSSKSQDLEIEIFVESQSDQLVIVEFVDFFFDDAGARVRLPSGSTPYSLANALDIQPFDPKYERKGKQQRFLVTLSPKDIDSKLLYAGGINIRLEPTSAVSSFSRLSSEASVLNSLIVSPYGIAGKLAEGNLLGAKITRHDLTRLDRSSLIDSILPDLPGVVNYGAVESTVYFENPGQYPVFTTLTWEFSSGGEIVASRQIPKAGLGPGQKLKKTVATQIPGQSEGVLLNVLPGLGFVSNKITLTSSLGGTALSDQVFDGSFVVLQWKEPFIGLVALYLLVRWAWRKNLSPQKRQESTSLFGLAIQGLARGVRRRLKSPKTPKPTTAVAEISNAPAGPQRRLYVPSGANYPNPPSGSSLP